MIRCLSARLPSTNHCSNCSFSPMSTSTPERPQLQFDFKAPLPTLPQLWTPDDIYLTCDEATVRRFSEDNRVERKLGTLNQKLLSEYVAMWSNTQPSGGVTFLGVDDDGKLVGCKRVEQAHINDLQAVRALCPDARSNSRPSQSRTQRDRTILFW